MAPKRGRPVLQAADVPGVGCAVPARNRRLGRARPFQSRFRQMRGKRGTFGGRAAVRRALYMATLAAIRFNRVIGHFYERFVTAGKPKKVAIVACMRSR